MQLTSLIATGVIALATGAQAFNGPEKIKPNNFLWGREGQPTTVQPLVKRETSTPGTSKTSSAVTASASSPAAAVVADSSCKNGPLTRACWGNGLSIATDFDTKWPTTGVTRRYTFDIRNTTCSPDGNGAQNCMLINNQYPGPLLTADWGDYIEVTVKNSMTSNGTSIHWHGIRQLNTVTQDGVSGITECPIAPGDSKVYRFQATQFGTTWYHSHFSAQYGNGVVGSIVINGPAAANYDIDLGPFPVNDWYYKTADQIESIAAANVQAGGPPPPGDNILVNGTNKNAAGGGSYGKTQLTPGKKHRLRIINASVDNSIRVSLDGHPFTVIASDLVPIKSYTTNWILLAAGQRYDVIINANAAPDNYWFRAEVAKDCAARNNFYGRSIFTYAGTSVANPKTSPISVAPTVCKDESPLVPWWNSTVPNNDFNNQVRDLEVNLNVQQVEGNGKNVVVWGVNLTAIDVDWRNPTLQYVVNKDTSYPRVYNLIELPRENIWTYWIIQETDGTPVPIPHPIHLHGHDFFILGAGKGVFNKTTDPANLNFKNPPRRDTTYLPGRGWVVIAFPTDNPGAWLMHCHIAWHISQGLGVQFLEAKDQIATPDPAWQQTCTTWRKFYDGPSRVYNKHDSGL